MIETLLYVNNTIKFTGDVILVNVKGGSWERVQRGGGGGHPDVTTDMYQPHL